MDRVFIKLIATIFISNYLCFIILNINMLVIGYSFLEYIMTCIGNIGFFLTILCLYFIVKK